MLFSLLNYLHTEIIFITILHSEAYTGDEQFLDVKVYNANTDNEKEIR
jgi:hypothetical protein